MSSAIASLGFPLIFVTLLFHGGAIFLTRHGYWLPDPAIEMIWSTSVVLGVALGLVLSVIPDRKKLP